MAEAPTPKQPLAQGNQQQHAMPTPPMFAFAASEEIAETTPEQGANRKKRVLPRPEREPRTFRQVHHNAFARMQEHDASVFLYFYNGYFSRCVFLTARYWQLRIHNS
jgi:hypothetical protein